MECTWRDALLEEQALPPDLLEAIRQNSDSLLTLLTKATLQPRYTNLIASHCHQVLAHICVTLPQYGSPAEVVATYGRLITISQDCARCASQYLESNTFDVLTAPSEAVTIYLLGVFRLVRHDRRHFLPYIRSSQLSLLLEGQSRANIYLVIRLLQIYLHGADHWFEEMLQRYLGQDQPDNAILGPWDDRTIDYRFLSLWESTRDRTLESLTAPAQQSTPITGSANVIRLSESAFSDRVALVGNEALLRSAAVTTKKYSIAKVGSTIHNLSAFAQGLYGSRPLLLTGQAGSGKTTIIHHVAEQLGMLDSLVTLHLNDQSDAKLLVGIYTSGETPGSIIWKPGVLTTAVQEGRWVIIEDIDRAPQHIVSALLPIIEHNQLVIPSRKQTLYAAQGFRLIATTQSAKAASNMLGRRHWQEIVVQPASLEELRMIISQGCASLERLLPQIMSLYERMMELPARTTRPHGPRDLFKWCSRMSITMQQSFNLDDIFLEAVDCFAGALSDGSTRDKVTSIIAEELHIDPQRREYLLNGRIIQYEVDRHKLTIGRYSLSREDARRKESTFSTNPHTLRNMERIAGSVINKEPLLLVGETGVGKTTSIQFLATHLGKKLIPFNLSQQSEAGDLLGGFKPVNIRTIVVALQDEFQTLFTTTFSHSRNQQFLEQLGKYLARGSWKAVCKLWRQALKTVEQQRRKEEPPVKKRRTATEDMAARWTAFADKLTSLEARLAAGGEKFAFAFIEGNIVTALRNGDWILLDEINLASSDTLEAIADLLDVEPSILLTEAGSVERIVAHAEFRVFAAMNPATDVGKKDLPPGVRSRFTELYVESPDKDNKSLQAIVTSYLRQEVTADPSVAADVSELYQEILMLAQENKLVDGAGQRPHFSLRTLTRTLSYARYIAPQCNLRRALYEGFQMSFMTFLVGESSRLVTPLLEKYLFRKRKEWRNELRKPLRPMANTVLAYPNSKHWISQGPLVLQEEPHYIITPFVERNLENLVRAASTRMFPILIQGPTSSGKTSMIEYLAKRSGHKSIRINNHEHTDLQEYLGTYVSTPDGTLQFQEGLLVQALREGHWIVLDELNLAPTDVLEALNRLLDDNRELLIPETQETVRPHDGFMLFATQNPAGLYGGRKALSRAFRNRFLELHFDDIPIDELQEILARRNPQLPGSRCKLIVDVYQDLAVLRQENRLFEQKSFATLRDLFRWAMRTNDTIEQLAENGFMLLAERVRKPEERQLVKDSIEKVMSKGRSQISLDEHHMYADTTAGQLLSNSTSNIVWTKAMKRLYTLIARAVANKEPVLLVGETGCGKTTVCQMLADTLGKELHIINAHQNTETGDLIGSQRPIRNRGAIEAELRSLLAASLPHLQDVNMLSTSALVHEYELHIGTFPAEYLTSPKHNAIKTSLTRYQALFEWVDGSLIDAMKTGSFFLLDEISLADDSVLERLNSVLEPSRSILLAEKGTIDSSITAKDGFRFFATMNPGGDYGKRELSPALRNRFTEIWVPSISDHEDIISIIRDGLVLQAWRYAPGMLSFAQWFKEHFDVSNADGISVREILAWKSFVNASENIPSAVVQGAAMVYIDTLGANPAGLMSLSGTDVAQARSQCLQQLKVLTSLDTDRFYTSDAVVSFDAATLSIGSFKLARQSTGEPVYFNFAARTTRLNSMRVARALQLPKPILLEGKPGVGKTALITALAGHLGVPLTRINLSDQTDLIDLFGADAPVEGSQAGTFAWRDAPFLKAMKSGEWVLLDEMNLASQSILEGLNAVLDHRGRAFIPELGLTFEKHPNFRLFAAQNPHHQGGGRKGLPASFVNRFTVVYADAFHAEDLKLLSTEAFPDVAPALIDKVVSFIQSLEHATDNKVFGQLGAPWEFNFRDIQKWLQLLTSKSPLLDTCNTLDTVKLLFESRFRTHLDRAGTLEIFKDIFEDQHESDLAVSISTTALQVGCAVMQRDTISSQADQTLPIDINILQSIMICVQKSWPVLLCAPSGSGKSQIIDQLAQLVGASVTTCSLNAETDAMDLIGGYEQVDARSSILQAVDDFERNLELLVKSDAANMMPTQQLQSIEKWRRAVKHFAMGRSTTSELCQELVQLRLPGAQSLVDLFENATASVNFSWIDGILVDAIQQGQWIVLENANLCSASVLDRLNSLLENNGMLVLNEHVEPDGSPRVIQPHPRFRIFLLTDPKHGELSRAMRNRTVELFVAPTTSETLRTESAMQRFSEISNIMRTTAADTLMHALHRLGHKDAPLVNRFLEQIQAGMALNAARSPLDVQDAIQHAFDTSTPQAVLPREYITKAQALIEDATSHRQLPADFAYVQSLQPLHNQPLYYRSAVTKVGTSLDGAVIQLSLAHDLLLDTHTVLTDLARRPPSSHLLRLERGLGINKPARSATYDGIKTQLSHIHRRLLTHFEPMEGWVGLATSQHVALNALRQFIGMASKDNTTESDFRAASNVLDDLGCCFFTPRVSAGALSLPIWHSFNPSVPGSVEEFDRMQQVYTLLSQFDEAAFRFDQSLETLVNLRNDLIQACKLVAKHSGPEVTELKELMALMDTTSDPDLNATVAKPDSAASLQTVKRSPHFLSHFKQLSTRHSLSSTDKENILGQRLDLLAMVQTRRSARSYIADALHIPNLAPLWEMNKPDDTSLLHDIKQARQVSIRQLPLLRSEVAVLQATLFKNSSGEVYNALEDALRSTGTALLRCGSSDWSLEQLTWVHLEVSWEAEPCLASLEQHLWFGTNPTGHGADRPTRNSAALAWTGLGLSALQSYLPPVMYDPASEAIFQHSALRKSHTSIKGHLSRLRSLAESHGRNTSAQIRLMEQVAAHLPATPANPIVYRPSSSQLPQIFALFDSIHRILEPMYEAFTEISIAQKIVLPLSQADLHNLWQVRSRLETFEAYMDFVGPIIYFLDCIMVGQYLWRDEGQDASTISIPFHGATRLSWRDPPTVGIDPILWLTIISLLATTEPVQQMPPDTRGLLEEQFGHLYEAWRRELTADQKQHAANGSLYKYQGDLDQDENEGAEELFSNESRGRSARIQDKAAEIAELHRSIFTPRPSSASAVLALLSKYAETSSARSASDNVRELPVLLHAFAQLKTSLQSGTSRFYTDPNTEQVTKLTSLVDDVVTRFQALHAAWPEHALPIEVLSNCDDIRNMPYSLPTPKYFQPLEKLHASLALWQTIASTEFSAAQLLDATSAMIISWRRLELSSWTNLFDDEDLKCRDNAASWWFTAYESIIAATASISGGDELSHIRDLVDTIASFLQSCGLGEYSTRLQLLRSFIKHITTLYESKIMVSTAHALSNLVDYLSKYETAVAARLQQNRVKLEKEIKDVILLASWKDTNVESLRQSATASHRKLFRVVRKYRMGLADPVASVIAAGLPALEILDSPVTVPAAAGPGYALRLLEGNAAWQARSQRYHHIDRTRNMILTYQQVTHQTTHERLIMFRDDVKQAAQELRKATPVIKTGKNEAILGHLKNRKRRLLADVLRELRTMGLQVNLSQDILQRQSTMSVVFARLPHIDATSPTQLRAQDQLHRLLTFMPAVREGVRKHSEDITPAEAARCVSLLESMLDTSLAQRSQLSELTQETCQLTQHIELVRAVAEQPCVKRQATTIPPKECQCLITMMRVCIELLREHQSATNTDLGAIIEQLHELAHSTEMGIGHMDTAMLAGLASENQLYAEKSLMANDSGLEKFIKTAVQTHPEIEYLVRELQHWRVPQPEAIPSIGDQSSDEWLFSLFSLLDDILSVVEHQRQADNGDETMWLQKAQNRANLTWRSLKPAMINAQLKSVLSNLTMLANTDDLPLMTAALHQVLPILDAYTTLLRDAAQSFWLLHHETNRMGTELATSFINLAKEGFCAPSDSSKDKTEGGEAESGTGLGDGEGAEDISKDVKDDEDLSELAQTNREKEDGEEDIKNEKDAVDMADEELEGQTQDVDADSDESSDEEGEQDAEEEVGSVNDDTTGALDEKMWDDGKVEEQQEKEAENSKGTKDDDISAANDKSKKDADDADVDPGDELMDDGEHMDDDENAERPELDGTDPHLQEQENLHLPDDLNMDGESASDDTMSLGDVDMEDASEQGETSEDQPTESPKPDAQDEEIEDNTTAGDEADVHEPAMEDEAPAQDDGLLQDMRQEDETELPAEGAVAGAQGTGQDEQDKMEYSGAAEADDPDESGTAQSQPMEALGQGETTAAQSSEAAEAKQAPSTNQASSQLKQLGDVLEKFLRQNKAIDAAQEDSTQDEQTSAKDTAKNFEHLAREDDKHDAQAVGTSTMDQSKALDEEDNMPTDDQETAEDMPIDYSTAEGEEAPSQLPQGNMPLELPSGPQVFVGSRKTQADDIATDNVEIDDENEKIDQRLDNTHISQDVDQMTIAEARRLWTQHESSTRNLSLMLTEHLRLILRPTQATRMRGDFRTGRRLNIKKIIPYIASSYKRDKIWMRRTTPSKRNYQIMLAIDDSKSMAENNSKDLAYATLAMVTRSLAMLEVGELCVLGFGEDITVGHDFSVPFTPDAGPEIFKSFTFNQNKTNVRSMLTQTIDLFRDARLRATGSASELWQLQIIISDGQCEDHAGIRRLVRQAQEERIMIVFVVVDAGYDGDGSKKSILDLPSAEFIKDANGEMQIKMTQYFDTFPFKFYLIVRDVLELPGVLAGALRQWFAEVVDTGPA